MVPIAGRSRGERRRLLGPSAGKAFAGLPAPPEVS